MVILTCINHYTGTTKTVGGLSIAQRSPLWWQTSTRHSESNISLVDFWVKIDASSLYWSHNFQTFHQNLWCDLVKCAFFDVIRYITLFMQHIGFLTGHITSKTFSEQDNRGGHIQGGLLYTVEYFVCLHQVFLSYIDVQFIIVSTDTSG